jgi:hypothetical protein
VAYRTFPHSPLRPGRATFTASGSPGIGDFPMLLGHRFAFHRSRGGGIRTAPNALQLFVNPTVNPLAPFAMETACPSSDYDGAADATVVHWLAARLQTVAARVHRDRRYATM